MKFIQIGFAVSLSILPIPAEAQQKQLSKATLFIMNEQIVAACQGRGGIFQAGTFYERDITGDGKKDLIIDHSGVKCYGTPTASAECRPETCPVRFYVRDGRLLRYETFFYGRNIVVADGSRPTVKIRGLEDDAASVQWNGRTFDWREASELVGDAFVAYNPDARWVTELWQSEGRRNAVVRNKPGNELYVSCDLGGKLRIGSSISIHIPDGKAPAGSVGEMTFDGRHTVLLEFNDENQIVVENTHTSISNFNSIVTSLKRYETVEVRLPDGKQTLFSLRGSSNAIGICPAIPTGRQLPVASAAQKQQTTTVHQPAVASGNSFADYPPNSTLKAAVKLPDFNGRDGGYIAYRSRIRDGVRGGMNFAGHYSFVSIGCGTNCRFAFVVDLRTGEVFDFPYGGEDQYQMDLLYFNDSRLLKVRWKDGWDKNTCTEMELVVDGPNWETVAERSLHVGDETCYYDMHEIENRGLSYKPYLASIGLSIELTDSGPQAAQTQKFVNDAKPGKGTDPGTTPQLTINADGREEELRRHNQMKEKFLKILGFDPGTVDGIIDEQAMSAFHAFQRDNNLEASNHLPQDQFNLLEQQAEAALLATNSPTAAEETAVPKQDASTTIETLSAVAPSSEGFASGGSAEKLYNDYGIRFSDEHPCTIQWDSDKRCKSFVLSEVREDSEAFFSGLRPGHVSTLFPQHIQQGRKTIDQYADDVLYRLRTQRFRANHRCDFAELLAAFQNGAPSKNTTCRYNTGTPFMLGRTLAETHVGVKMDDKGVVVSILEPSPASIAGIRVGDRLLRPGGGPSDLLSENLLGLDFLLRNVVNKGQRGFVHRNGEFVEIKMPKVPFGQVVDPALEQTKLTAQESKVFEELPRIIRPFLTAVYGGRFVRAEFEKKAFYLKAYSVSLAAQIGETSYGNAVTAKYGKLVDNSRFGPLLAQYALVKLSGVGNCANPTKTVAYTETLIQTIQDGFGVPLSRRVLSQESKSFEIDARFAPYVVNGNQVSPRPRWSRKLGNFIGSAGGCGSQILEQFEENMLAYQKY